MRLGLIFIFALGCAQATPVHNTDGGFNGHHDGGLVFEEDGGPSFQPPDLAGRDLAGAATLPDLATAATQDLALPPGTDLAGSDLAHVVTAVENCFNTLDDDGNGKVNDGCPDTVTVGADAPLMGFGGPGGGAVSAHCPAGQVVTALRFYGDSRDQEIAGIALGCSTPTLVKGASSYSITLDDPSLPTTATTFYGTRADFTRDGVCDTTQFQLAWRILMNTNESGADPFVHGLGMSCGLGALTLSASNQLTIAFTDLDNQFGINYAWGSEHPQYCGAQQALVGFNGHDGSWLDQIQPICADLVFTYKM